MISRLKLLARGVWADAHMREVALGTLLALAIRVGGAALGFGFNVAVARLAGAQGAGLYFLALSFVSIGSILGSVGLGNALIRFVAAHAAHNEWGAVRAVHALGIRFATFVAGTLSVLGFLLAPWIAEAWFHKPLLVSPLSWMSLSILPVTLITLEGQALKSVKRVSIAMIIQAIGIPLISLALIWPLARISVIDGAAWAVLAAAVIMALLAKLAWWRAMAGREADDSHFPFGKLWAACKPMLIVSIMGEAIMPYAPTFLLGVWGTAADVGVFGAASRLALLMSFLLAAANNVIAPKFAELYARGDIDSLHKVARHSALLNTLLAIPFFLILVFFGAELLALFGKEFTRGAGMLAVLAVGQLVNLATGSVGNLLLMTGHEGVFRNLTIACSVLVVLCSVILIPSLGGMGAALASAITVAALNIAATFSVKRFIGIDVSVASLLPRKRNIR